MSLLRHARNWLILAAVVVLGGVPVFAANPAGSQPDEKTFQRIVWPFLDAHCTKCHSEARAKGGLNLEELQPEFVAGSRDAQTWQEVMDRLNLGEMPPEDEPRPRQEEADAVNAWILTELRRAVANSRDGAGRVVMRRMNREEYNYTVHDLLGLSGNPADLFPADNTAHGFDNIGTALTMSPLLVEKYLNAAQKLLDRAIVTGPRPKPALRRVEIEDLSRHFTRQKTRRTFHGGFMVRGTDFLLMTRSKIWLPQIDTFRFATEGEYAFRVRAGAVEGGSYPPRMVMEFDGAKIWEGDVTASDQSPKVYEARIPVGRSTSGGRRVFRVANSNFDVQHTMPLALDSMEIEGPLYDDWPPESHRRIFFKSPDAERNPAYAREIISRFAAKAFRRPILDREIDRLMGLFSAEIARESSFEEAVKVALSAVLCAPDFLFLLEPGTGGGDSEPRRLNAYELATRLSYFLWRSMPDGELIARAADGSLTEAEMLETQIRRMLADAKSGRFVKSFAGQWLQTRLVGSFPPDAKLYPEYDYHLETSMVRETEAFFAEILRHDLSALNFIDSDFAMLNERMARHYGIRGVKGDDFRRVSLPANSRRGGVMTHASILAGLSDGTRTKPIKRGVWILENLLGDPPPPPPPNAGEIEPNKKGQAVLSLRQRMVEHRQNSACASCHRKIDPLGFSLQNYDAIGAWRTHETGVEEPIDASGKLPDGTEFQTPEEFKRLLMEQKDAFCRCLTEKLLTFALGRGLEITDRELLDQLSRGMSENGYRLADSIVGIAKSDAFQTK